MSAIDKTSATSNQSEIFEEAMTNLKNAFAISDALMSLREGGRLVELADVTFPTLMTNMWESLIEAKRSFEEYAKNAQKEAA